ncbi:MAG: hypothetical protein IJR84_03230, partial [Bacteroidaceae bacterium]|nr:hypothetical protein [Bacteroidaceae bacterium]
MKKFLTWVLAATLSCGTTVFTSCSKDDDNVVNPVKKDYFTQWNTCEALTALKAYVEDVTNPNSPNFI